MKIEEISEKELHDDRLASIEDILVCENALALGITTYGINESVLHRKQVNERIVADIDQELQRRANERIIASINLELQRKSTVAK